MKSKLVKKLIAASLVTAMSVSMVGCGNDANTAGNQSSEAESSVESSAEQASDSSEEASVESSSEEEDLGQYTVITDADGNPIDLGGMEIIIRDWWSSGEEEEAKNAYEEARNEYRDWIQETYNFTIKEIAISDWGSTPEDFATYAATGGDENYIFTLRQGSELTAAMNNGLMYDLATLDCLDFSEEKWNTNGLHEFMTKGDSIYGMRGIAPEARGGLYFNKRLLEEAGLSADDIYTWQENGEWTWEKFEEVCQQIQADTDNDGVIDRYAMVNFAQTFYCEAVASNDGDFVAMDDSGKYYNDLESEETIAALNWALEMMNTYDYPQPADSNWDYWKEAFINGAGCFIAGEAYMAGQDWANMEDDFGFVCFPMGPAADDYTNIYTDNPYVIPACYDAEKAWKIAFAYNLYTEPIPGYEDYNDALSGYYDSFRDTESVDYTIARLTENGRVTYHTMIPNLALGSDLLWGLSKDNTPAQAAEAIRNTWASYIDEANK